MSLNWKPADAPRKLSSYLGNNCNPGVETFSISWTKDRSLISGGSGHVALIGCDLQLRVCHTKTVRYADCIREFSDHYIAMLYNHTPSSYLQPLSKSLDTYGKSFAKMVPQSFCHFCVTASAVAVVNKSSISIDIYDRMDLEMKKSIRTDLASLRGIHALDDNTAVVTDHDTHVVRLYELDTETVVWTYTGAKHPSGISSDAGGFIYVAANEPKEICVLSPDGKAYPVYWYLFFCFWDPHTEN
mgnify:CR=1 FL=1